ncbi:MAG: M28 family peptidase [Bacteroidales bacterium]|nr:M28 family peptidase [Bacteroidales bacterium]
MNQKKILFPILLLLCVLFSQITVAQDIDYVKSIVRKLGSPRFHGRGYVKNGDADAARFLSKEMKKAGLAAYTPNYFQPYSFAINTFPSRVNVMLDGKRLKPGKDFVVHPSVQTRQKSYSLIWLDDTVSHINSVYSQIDTNAFIDKMLVVPEGLKNAYKNGIPGVDALVQRVSGNMWWHVSGGRKTSGYVILKMNDKILSRDNHAIAIDIENKFIEKHEAVNLIGYVEGCKQPDSFFVFVAHYDHLGQMGKHAMFPGASDNASGTATVLDLGHFYQDHPEKAYYTMVFILVSGEEAGLLGSTFFTENPLIPLEKVKFVINLDMVGAGSEGLSVVNALQYPDAADLIDSINNEKHYFSDIRRGGESCNSDHCPFYQKGVPAFFLFTRGAENHEYHTITDTYDRLPFTAYQQLFGILTDFVDRLSQKPNYRKN